MKTTQHTRAHHPISVATSDYRTVAVIGLGYVGLPLARLAAERGHTVIGFDIDGEKARKATGERLRGTTDARKLAAADSYIVCVPTPVSDTHEPDLRPLKSACMTIAPFLKTGDLVVVESTVNPGVCEEVVLPILETSGLAVEKDFYLAHCPERINPGDAHWDTETIPRVLGAAGARSLDRARDLYRSIITSEVKTMGSLKEAEAVKMVENTFRDVNIAFVNELAQAFDKAGIDLLNVIAGASSKPFAFMPHYPGAGVGGHCIPVDPYYLIRYGAKNGFKHRFLETARAINNRMPAYTVSLLAKALHTKHRTLKGATIALLGLAYKRDIGDERESPAHDIHRLLLKRGALVRSFDPFVPFSSTTASLEDALTDADAALIATDHSAFRALTPFHFMRTGVAVVIDGRNCLRKEDFAESGILYSGIGRAGI